MPSPSAYLLCTGHRVGPRLPLGRGKAGFALLETSRQTNVQPEKESSGTLFEPQTDLVARKPSLSRLRNCSREWQFGRLWLYVRIKAGDVRGPTAGNPSVTGEEARGRKTGTSPGQRDGGLLSCRRPTGTVRGPRDQRGLAPGLEAKTAPFRGSVILAAQSQETASELNFMEATGLGHDSPPRPALSWGFLCSDHPAWLFWSRGLWAPPAGLPRACQA